MGFLWDYVIGPVLALLPRGWRRLTQAREADWRRAATASGIYELIGAVIGVAYWYSYDMERMVNSGVDAALNGKMGGGVTDLQIGGVALTVFMLHPLTWLLLYFALEGGVRLCGAAFTESVLGTLPLYLTERVVSLVAHPGQAQVGDTVRENASSFAGSIRERVMTARLENVADQLEYKKSGTEEWLEIRASRRKEEWVPPRTVRVDDEYYRLEESSVGKGPRPFCYRLRRVAAGVPGRNVILYRSGE